MFLSLHRIFGYYLNVQFIKCQSKYVVHFSLIKMRVSSLINSHVFINTHENHKITNHIIPFNYVDGIWLDCRYGLHQLWYVMIFHYVIGKAVIKRMFHHLVKNLLASYTQKSLTLLLICFTVWKPCYNKLGQWRTWEWGQYEVGFVNISPHCNDYGELIWCG